MERGAASPSKGNYFLEENAAHIPSLIRSFTAAQGDPSVGFLWRRLLGYPLHLENHGIWALWEQSCLRKPCPVIREVDAKDLEMRHPDNTSVGTFPNHYVSLCNLSMFGGNDHMALGHDHWL